MFPWELDEQERLEKEEDEKNNLQKIYNFNYKFPLSIYIVFEKCDIFVMTSEKMYRNHYVLYLHKNFYTGVFSFLKNEVFFSNSTLIDQSIIDLNHLTHLVNKSSNSNSNFDFIKPNNSDYFILFNIFYCYFIKIRITFFTFLNELKKIQSTDLIYKNSSWLERETSEMFGISFLNKTDSRCLLLDYSKNENPMLKSFPCEGYYDIYYNFFEHKLKYINNDIIEL